MSELDVEVEAPKHILDARAQAAKLLEKYKTDPRQNSFRVLITGESGSGKTSIARTARMPLHVDSFDPGGTIVLRDLVHQGQCVADTIYETEDRLKPEMFREWCRNFEQRLRSKYFESFGTYMLDSSTMWAEAIMNYILVNAHDHKGNKVDMSGKAPRFTLDYTPQKAEIANWMKRITSLPCDIIVTGHLEGEYEGTGENKVLVRYKYMTTGQGAITIPLQFDEQWTMIREERAGKPDYKVLTSIYRLYRGRTRIGRNKFVQFEEPDIKALLKKAGWPSADKPALI